MVDETVVAEGMCVRAIRGVLRAEAGAPQVGVRKVGRVRAQVRDEVECPRLPARWMKCYLRRSAFREAMTHTLGEGEQPD